MLNNFTIQPPEGINNHAIQANNRRNIPASARLPQFPTPCGIAEVIPSSLQQLAINNLITSLRREILAITTPIPPKTH
jgi:hypothetical protein